MSRGRVVVGMSGGVDSSVAAYLLKEQGFEVIGLFMKNWEDDDDDQYCSTRQDLIDAAAVADVIGVELEAVNFSEHYRERVFAEFLREYSAGRTPNPDVLCNAEIKFKAFLDHAMTLGADTIATGHYAQVREADGQFQLLRAADRAKDQSYFLHRLTQAQLARTLFPLGRLQKPAVRAIAERIGLHNAQKKDSTGICFIGERPFREFLSRYLPSQPGPMQTVEGERVGEHIGLAFYTLGQRKGIGVGGLRQHSSPDGRSAPWFVAGKDMSTNTLTIAQGHEHPALFTEGLWAETPSWIAGVEPPDGPYTAKTRYRQADAPCRLERGEAQFALSFDQPQWAVTPGQSAVLYAGEVCLGGGVIAHTRAVQNAHTASLAAS